MDPGRRNCSASARMVGCSTRIGETLRMLLGVTLLQREVLEAKAVGGASTVTGGDRRHALTLTAHSEPYNGTVLHASRLKTKRECARSCDCRNTMWPRETTARSGDIGAASDRHRQSQCLRVLQRSTVVCAEAKNTKSLAARAGACRARQSADAERECDVRTRTVRC